MRSTPLFGVVIPVLPPHFPLEADFMLIVRHARESALCHPHTPGSTCGTRCFDAPLPINSMVLGIVYGTWHNRALDIRHVLPAVHCATLEGRTKSISLTRVTKSYLLALGTTQISSYTLFYDEKQYGIPGMTLRK